MNYDNQRQLAQIEREEKWAIATSNRKQAAALAESKKFNSQVAQDKFSAEFKVIKEHLAPQEQLEAMTHSIFKLLKHNQHNRNK